MARRDDRSAEAVEYRKLYKTARWQAIRRAQLQAHPLCSMCKAQGRTTAATVCNHTDKASKTTVEGFYAGPFSSLCAPCHDGPTQRDESREAKGLMVTRACGADGWPL